MIARISSEQSVCSVIQDIILMEKIKKAEKITKRRNLRRIN